MKRKHLSILLTFILAIILSNTAHAGFITSIPNHIKEIGAEDNELLKLGFLDVTLYGADPTGQNDSTAAIQQAVNDARKHQLVTFFPHQKNGKRGIYLVSDTIDCRMRQSPSYDYGKKSNIIVGSTRGSIRPLIKVKPGAPVFSKASDPQPVFWFWSQAGHWEPEQYRNTNNPWDNDQDISFNQMIRGIDIDLGENPGAIGIKNPGAQGQAIENVTIYAKGAFAGLGNLAGLGSGEYDVTVIGGRYGIYIDTMKRTLSPYNGKVSLIGSKFIDQEEAVIRIVGRQPSPVMFVGFLIENKKSIPFNIGKVDSGRGGFVLVSGIVDVPGGKFINRDNMGLYLKDVYFRGVSTIVDDWKISDKQNWTHVIEYASHGDNYTNLIDGKLSDNVIASKKEGLDYSKSELFAKLVVPHQWNEWSFPNFQDPDIVNVKTYGAKGDGLHDDTTAIQKAIDENEKIFLPKGLYLVSKTIVLKKDTKLIGSSKITSIIMPHPDWQPKTEAFIISTVDSKSGSAILSDLLIANHGTDKYANDKIDTYNDRKVEFLQADQYNFTPIQWRVGRYSILRDVISGTAGTYVPREEQRNAYHRFRINGYGGGKWFSVVGAWAGNQANSRGMIIEDTDEPMYIYPTNFARDPANRTVDIINSKNKFFFYPAFEGGKTAFYISNSDNIAIFTSHKNNIPSLNNNRGVIEVDDSSNILISMFNTRLNNDSSFNQLIETIASSKHIINGKKIGLYKRGSVNFIFIDDANASHGKLPSPGLRIKKRK